MRWGSGVSISPNGVSLTGGKNGDYEEAARAFEAAIAIYPDSDNNADTTRYPSQTYIELEKTDKAIDSYLANAGASVSMTMTFQFSKEMDASSVEAIYNWTITRAESDNIAETNDYGDEIPSTEITLEPYPDYVIYDTGTQTATLGFTITQNETADGTIDPSHIVFTFDGEDVYGLSISGNGDEYSGFSGSA